MEASTLKNKKGTINKGKIKKNIKNVLCRPDPVIWPQITEEERKRIELALAELKIEQPEFTKPPWEKLKLIPKDQRPKPPKLNKVDGFLFGIRECTTALLTGQCSAVVIEATLNPRMIAQPIIEACSERQIPIICLNDLKKICSTSFAIPTSCLGIKCDSLPNLWDEISDIAKNYPIPRREIDKVERMDTFEEHVEVEKVFPSKKDLASPYLYRTNKKSRVFVPSSQNIIANVTGKFIGQDFIEFSNKQELNHSKGFMKMMLKKISNNADRVKKK